MKEKIITFPIERIKPTQGKKEGVVIPVAIFSIRRLQKILDKKKI